MGARQTEWNKAGQHITATEKVSCSSTLACGSLENRCSSTYPCGITKMCYNFSYSKKIYYRWQDPHILSIDLLQLMRDFFKTLGFCQHRVILAHMMKPFRRKIMEMPDMHVSVCQQELWQSWGHPCWRWQQRVQVEGWLRGSSAAVTWQGHVCTAQPPNPVLPHYLWLMRSRDPIITKDCPNMHEVP